MNDRARNWLATGLTLTIATASGALFAAAGLPVPWLSGPMVAVGALAIAGHRVAMARQVRDLGFLVAGTALGSTVNHEALALLARYPVSIIGLAAGVIAVVAATTLLLQRRHHWDRTTAFLASIPGALSVVMAVAAESNADERRVVVVQSVRLFVLMVVLPFVIMLAPGVSAAVPRSVTSLPELAALFAASTALALVFVWLRVVSALFLGGMVASAGLHLSGIIPDAVPDLVMQSGALVIGAYCGVRFVGTTGAQLVALLRPSLEALVITLGLSLIAALLVHALTGINLAAVLVAFAPGGLEAMVLMGAAMGLDTLYISTHHTVRIIGLMLATPVVTPRSSLTDPAE
ncbi:MAG TPA: AbrB family transcriptional regulator [Beijerinckiaceae bacterium]|nr:AbrB family transcriptional regulator [Beijerinckiaceae bacterium]